MIPITEVLVEIYPVKSMDENEDFDIYMCVCVWNISNRADTGTVNVFTVQTYFLCVIKNVGTSIEQQDSAATEKEKGKRRNS